MSGKDIQETQLTETFIEGEVVYQGRLLEVHRDRVALPNGRESTREYIRHPGAAAMIARLPDGRILLIRQFRWPGRQIYWEVPAGKLDAGEPPEVAAARELLEETGYRAGTMTYLMTQHLCIGYSDEVIHLYLADDLAFTGQQLDDNEFLEVVPLTLEEALGLAGSGQIVDAKTLTALLWAEKVLGGRWQPCPDPFKSR